MLASVPDLLVSLQTGMCGTWSMELCVLQNVQHVCVWKIRMKLDRECRTHHMWMRLKSVSCCSLHGRHWAVWSDATVSVKLWQACRSEEGKHQPTQSRITAHYAMTEKWVCECGFLPIPRHWCFKGLPNHIIVHPQVLLRNRMSISTCRCGDFMSGIFYNQIWIII